MGQGTKIYQKWMDGKYKNAGSLQKQFVIILYLNKSSLWKIANIVAKEIFATNIWGMEIGYTVMLLLSSRNLKQNT